MSQENVEIVAGGYEYFAENQDLQEEIVDPDFVWDMQTFPWPGTQLYEGIEGSRTFLAEWIEAWEDWELEVERLLDAGDDVVAIVRQRGRSKASGVPVDMHFAQVWTIRDRKQVRMRMYADPAEALEAVGLSEQG
ncbi:MAG: nuclear transport factor 2 family protein [Solirubrobacterales bacterium]